LKTGKNTRATSGAQGRIAAARARTGSVTGSASTVDTPPAPPHVPPPKTTPMLTNLLRSKILRAEVTDAKLHYEGSMEIDEALMRLVGILPNEKILVGNISNGQRFETYAIPAPAGSRRFSLNGAVAHLGAIGDLVVIMTFGWFDAAEAAAHRPSVVTLGSGNSRIVKLDNPAVAPETCGYKLPAGVTGGA
jgi:aspartate 1-decarboxylase